MSASPVYLHGPRYVLGEVGADYTSITDLPAKAERFRMQVNAGLWGWGGVYRTERPLEAMAIDSGTATLAAAGLEPSTIDALVLCCTWLPGSANDHGRFVRDLLTSMGLGDIPCYGQTLNRCVNLLAGLDVAHALVAAGRHRRVLVITTDRVFDEADRMVNYALFSDGAASCVVSSDAAGGGYQLVSCAIAQQASSLEWSTEISSDLARQVNEALLTPLGMKTGDLAGLLHANIFKPLLTMKELQAGFTPEQLYTANIARLGHCFAADPLINLVDRAALGHIQPDRFYQLASSVPGSRIGVLLRKLDH